MEQVRFEKLHLLHRAFSQASFSSRATQRRSHDLLASRTQRSQLRNQQRALTGRVELPQAVSPGLNRSRGRMRMVQTIITLGVAYPSLYSLCAVPGAPLVFLIQSFSPVSHFPSHRHDKTVAKGQPLSASQALAQP